MSRRFKLWIGVCAVVTAIAIASFACAMKTGGVEFNQKPVLERSEGMVEQAFPPVKVGNFVSRLSVRIQNIEDVIARQFDRSGTSGAGIPGPFGCDGILVNQVIDEFPANASENVLTSVLERSEGFTRGIPQSGQRSELNRLLHLGMALLKILIRTCLKRSKHAM